MRETRLIAAAVCVVCALTGCAFEKTDEELEAQLIGLWECKGADESSTYSETYDFRPGQVVHFAWKSNVRGTSVVGSAIGNWKVRDGHLLQSLDTWTLADGEPPDARWKLRILRADGRKVELLDTRARVANPLTQMAVKHLTSP